MTKDIMITLRGLQDDDDNPIELLTTGSYLRDGDKHIISYEESEMTGMEGTTTTLEAVPGKVIMTRSGSRNNQMIFEEGKQHLCCYETPYGDFTIGVSSHEVHVEIEGTRGRIDASYQLEFNNMYHGDNRFIMEFTEVQQ